MNDFDFLSLDLTDPATQRFVLVAVQSLFVLGFVIETYRTANAVKDKGLTAMFWKASLYGFVFLSGRLIATAVDNYFGFRTAWFSSAVMISLFAALYWRARIIRLVMSSPKNDEIRIQLRADLIAIKSNLTQARQNLKEAR